LIPKAKISVHPHPVYDGFEQKSYPKTLAREKLHLPPKTPLLLMFGFVRPYKGLHILLDALGELRKHDVDCILVVAGEFWDDKDSYTTQIQQLGLYNHVRIEDSYLPDEDVALFFSAADVLVAPYVAGTQSGAASWAAGFGLPIIISDLVASGLTDIDPQQTLITPAGDAKKLAETIEAFLQRPILESKIDFNRKDSWKSMIDTLITLSHSIKQGN
jgi:D-inositol-3-phosphate glycosyltransferase